MYAPSRNDDHGARLSSILTVELHDPHVSRNTRGSRVPKIRRVMIQNFRSIRKVEYRVSDLAIMVGDNDCGKSNLLRALNLFFNGHTNPDQAVDFSKDFNFHVNRRKRAKEIIVELDLELPATYRGTNGDFVTWRKVWREDGVQDARDYVGYRIKRSPRGAELFDRVEIPQKSNVHALLSRISFEYVPAIRSVDFFRQLRGRIYGVIAQVAEEGFRQRSSDFEGAIAENVAPLIADVLEQLRDDTKLKLPNDLSAIFERLDFLSGEESISLDNRGDGIKGRYIPLILKFIAEKRQSLLVRGGQPYTFIWAYEEPENNLEFRRAQELAETFRKLARDELTQIFITTHSPVFFNMHEGDGDLCCVRYVRREDPEAGTVVEQSVDGLGALDERMGVMPIIAPYIRKAQEQVEHLRARRDEVEGLLSAQRRPTLFVEGTTDHKVLSHLLARFRPQATQQVHLALPPSMGAGANYVADSLIAWGLVQRSRPVDERCRAFGIFDLDEAGSDAKARVEEAGLKTDLVRSCKLPRPPHLHEAAQRGLAIPVALEELYPPDWWRQADRKGWLGKRDRQTALSPVATARLVNGETTWDTLVAGADWSIYVEKCVAEHRKGTWADFATKAPDATVEEALAPVLQVLDQALAFLGGKLSV